MTNKRHGGVSPVQPEGPGRVQRQNVAVAVWDPDMHVVLQERRRAARCAQLESSYRNCHCLGPLQGSVTSLQNKKKIFFFTRPDMMELELLSPFIYLG